jgi:hypothetical protein
LFTYRCDYERIDGIGEKINEINVPEVSRLKKAIKFCL